jgi:hypothetical protein
VRIKDIRLAWFRGASDPVSLDLACKSMVAYGVNASGKSSFVDAIEYVLNNGRVGHLAHEYSGKHLKNALPNAFKPKAAKTELSITLCDESDAKIEINEDGSTNGSGPMLNAISEWDYRRTVLRQDEVVAFIHDTKGGKYSALLPLFGLHEMEIAAENLRQVAKNVESLSALDRVKLAVDQAHAKRRATFGVDTEEEILRKLGDLHGKYCADKLATKDGLSRCSDLKAALEERTARLSADQRRHLTLHAAGELGIRRYVDSVRAASVALAGAVDPLIAQKLAVLQPAEVFGTRVSDDGDIQCPACGQSIGAAEFRDHVKEELERLREIRKAFNARNGAIGELCDAVRDLTTNLGQPDVKLWRDELAGKLPASLAYLENLDVDRLRTGCGETDLKEIESKLLPIVDAAALASVDAPPDLKRLLDDKGLVDLTELVLSTADKAENVQRVEALISVIASVEHATREEIRLRSEAVIAEISEDIKQMWSILHPGEAIENVRLYLPSDADKAIDISLKFYGKELHSPRLTLSEGYRNSLGLCIFLAMAKREARNDRPVFLDDVVVSLDRNHRGMIVELLTKYFAKRQVVIFTHDRDWYTELRQQLDPATWTFKSLLPYETPEVGIRWSHKTTTFDDARAHMNDRPDSAGNDARKIMDVELALIAERFQIKLPYLRFDKNDKRMAHEFLERLYTDGVKCFQIRRDGVFTANEGAIEALKAADQLLVSWGNRASHSADIVRSEAAKLIDVCERALETFKCASCNKPVWFADAEKAEWVQCQCGEVRWRYGKG